MIGQVIVSTEDDDEAGFLLSQTIASVSENGTTDTFTVRLTSRPDTNVVLTVISADPDEADGEPDGLDLFARRLEFPANGDSHGRGRSPDRRQPDDAGHGERGRRSRRTSKFAARLRKRSA